LTHHACQCYLFRETVSWLALQKIEPRIIGNRQRNSRDRPCVCHAGDRAHLLQLRVDEGHASVEVLVTEQRRLERQQPFGADSQIGVPQMLKSLQEQTAAYQQCDSERRLDNDERMLEPMAARAGSAAASIAQSILRTEA